MKTAIMQPYFFPYIGYFQLIHSCDTFVFYDDVNFIKKGWINRNYIHNTSCVSNTVIKPILSKISQNKKINEISIKNEWQDKMLKTLTFSYSKAKYFKKTYSLIKSILKKDVNTIADFNIFAISKICEELNLERNLIKSSNQFSSSIKLKKQHRLIKICKELNSEVYINSIGGRLLYEKEEFKNNNINLLFINKKNLDFSNQNLSIIHLMMHFDIKHINKWISMYDLS